MRSTAGAEEEVPVLITLHVSADFSPWARDPDVLIRWIPAGGRRAPLGRAGPGGHLSVPGLVGHLTCVHG